jgi:hypothetical protein
MALRQIPTISSTNILAVAYDDESGDLYVQFVRPGTSPYKFAQVPLQVAEGFSRSDSPGRYFRGEVLNQFQHEIIGSVPQIVSS